MQPSNTNRVALDGIAEAGFQYAGLMTAKGKSWILITCSLETIDMREVKPAERANGKSAPDSAALRPNACGDPVDACAAGASARIWQDEVGLTMWPPDCIHLP
jgi:hypothetical protein